MSPVCRTFFLIIPGMPVIIGTVNIANNIRQPMVEFLIGDCFQRYYRLNLL